MQLLDRGSLGHVADVGSGGENPWPAGEHDGSHAVIGVEFAEGLVDLADELRAQCVQNLGPVQGYGRDRGLDVKQDVLVTHPAYHRPCGDGKAEGLLRPGRGRPPDLDHRPLQLPLHLLHAGGGSEVAGAG